MVRKGIIYATQRQATDARAAIEDALGVPFVGRSHGPLGEVAQTAGCSVPPVSVRTEHLLAVLPSHTTSEWILEIPDDLATKIIREGREVPTRTTIPESHSQPGDAARGR